MTLITTAAPVAAPGPAGRDWIAAAQDLVPALAELAPRHDRDGSFVAPGIALLRDAGILGMAAPAELGGGDARTAEVTWTLEALARGCPSTALVAAMHLHTTLTAAWRHRRDGSGAGMLRRAAGGALVSSTGGVDLARPAGRAERVEGGFLLSGRKGFVSGAPAAELISAWFPYDDPEAGMVCLGAGISPHADEVQVVGTWDALGMRGTGSDEVVVRDLFVPDAAVSARRAFGRIDGPLAVMLTHFAYAVSGVYLGVADAARELVTGRLAERPRAARPEVQCAVGECEHHVRSARWALAGAMAEMGEEPAPDLDGLRRAMLAKRAVVLAATTAVDRAVEAAGGSAFSSPGPLGRLSRDVRAAALHGFSPEATLLFTGRAALGQDAATM